MLITALNTGASSLLVTVLHTRAPSPHTGHQGVLAMAVQPCVERHEQRDHCGNFKLCCFFEPSGNQLTLGLASGSCLCMWESSPVHQIHALLSCNLAVPTHPYCRHQHRCAPTCGAHPRTAGLRLFALCARHVCGGPVQRVRQDFEGERCTPPACTVQRVCQDLEGESPHSSCSLFRGEWCLGC